MAEPSENFHTGLEPEETLLLCCVRTQMDTAHVTQALQLLQNNIDWDTLIEMAYHHNVASLLYRNLESVASAMVPETVRTSLKQQIQKDVQGNLSLTKELLALLGLFDQHGIQVIPYKGPVLSTSVYHDLALRSFGDLDILVHENDVLQVMDLLVSCGYEIIRPNSVTQVRKSLRSFWVKQLINTSPWAYQLILWNPEREGIVEIHWRIVSKYALPRRATQLWDDLQPVTVGGKTFLSFSPENLLWFLCLHGAKHQWRELRHLCDVAELLREYPDLDWERVIAEAAELGVERRLYLGLYLACFILDAPLPLAIQTKISAMPRIKILAEQVMENFFNSKEQPTTSKIAFQLKAMDRLGDRVLYFLRFFRRIDSAMTVERRFIKRFSFVSLSSRLLKLLT